MFQLIRTFFYCYIPLSLFFMAMFGFSSGTDAAMNFLDLIVFGTGFIMTANAMKTNPSSGGKQGAFWILANLLFGVIHIVVASESGGGEELELSPIGIFASLLAIAALVFEIVAMIWLFNNSSKLPSE